MKKPTDKERLDWLQKNMVNLICPMAEFKTWALTSDKNEWINSVPQQATARKAIDAAMDQEAKNGH